VLCYIYCTMSTVTSQPHRFVTSAQPVQKERSKNLNLLHRWLMFFTPRSQAISIKIGLEQAREIQEGKAQAKSFEEAIAEL